MYIVKFDMGSIAYHYHQDVFVTSNRALAKRYIEKANKIINRHKAHFSRMNDKLESLTNWDEDLDFKLNKREDWLRDFNKAFYHKIEVR